MDRREFVKLTTAGGGVATLVGCGSPGEQLIRFIPDEESIPGVSLMKPGVCPLCPAGCGLQVRVMAGDVEVKRQGRQGVVRKNLVKKLEGNPYHPVNQGKLCVRGQAGIQITYHPDRIRQPLKRSGERGSGEFEPVSWEDAMAELVSRLDGLATSGNRHALGFLTRPLSGGRHRLVNEFLRRFGAPPPITFEVFGEQVLRRANAASFGFEQLPTLDLAHSNYVIGFGADFLGTWNSPVSQNVAYGNMRRGRPGVRGKFVQVEPRMSQTGANADEWIPVRSGTEGVLALGLAHLILGSGLRSGEEAGRAGNLIEGWSDGLPAYSPDRVETITGVDASRIQRLAREFAENTPAVALVGGAPLAQTNGFFHALGVNALNALVGSVQAPGGIVFTPRPAAAAAVLGEGRSLHRVAAEMQEAQDPPIQVLLLNDANPVFGAPPAWGVAEALSSTPYIASFGHFLDETSSLADLILPDHSFLESWIDGVPESGTRMAVVSLAAPAMRPLHETRAMPDVLLEIAVRLGQSLTPALPWRSYRQMLRASFEALPAIEGSMNTWDAAQEQGGWWRESPLPAPSNAAPGQSPVSFEEPEFDGDHAGYPFHFLPYASQAFLDGSLAHLPWLQELPDPISSAMWSSWVEINPKTASDSGIGQGDLVEIASTQGRLRAPAFLSPGIAPDVIAMPVGQGHENFTRYASGRGANPVSILAPMEEKQTGALAWAATRVRVSRVEGEGRLILFGGSLTEHPEHTR